MSDDWARPLVHWELQARDVNALSAFYRDLFNWQVSGDAAKSVGAGIGGPEPGPAGTIRPGSHPGVSLYFQVRDLGASLAKAEQLGGKVISQPFDTPGGPTIAGILDPEGNRVMLVQQ